MITVAASAGFCFGVKRAVGIAFDSARVRRTATLGEIIHNPDTVAELSAAGVRVIDSPEEAAAGETVIIRSHGVADDVFRRLEELDIPYIDGTCPFVAKIHRIARECPADGIFIIAGDKDHPEVRGIAGSCPVTPVIAADERELDLILGGMELSGKKVCAAAQTTFNAGMWERFAAAVKRHCPSAVIYDTICSATHERQREAAGLAALSDIMIVVGGKHSSNTRDRKSVV